MPDERLLVTILQHHLVPEIPTPGTVEAYGGRLLEVTEVAVVNLRFAEVDGGGRHESTRASRGLKLW